jgi:hypothetical protein
MTAISAPRGYARTTPFERSLLWTSATIDHFVAHRLERRAATERHRALTAQIDFAEARRNAQATGGIGMLPR